MGLLDAVGVQVATCHQNVGVGMIVCEDMRVRRSAVGVGNGVGMHVRVADQQRVDDDQHGASRHNCQRQKEMSGQRLPQNEQRQRRADERRNGIIGAGLCRAQALLRPDIEEDAEAVCDNPRSIAASAQGSGVSASPRSMATSREPSPEKVPLIMTI